MMKYSYPEIVAQLEKLKQQAIVSQRDAEMPTMGRDELFESRIHNQFKYLRISWQQKLTLVLWK